MKLRSVPPREHIGAAIVALTLASAAATPSPQEPSLNKGPQGTTLEQYRKFSAIRGSRKINIAPIRPSTGITTGMVMIYGHIVLPPYAVDIQEKRLAINGVQVKPSLVKAQQQENLFVDQFTPDQKARRRRIGRLQIRAREIYDKKPAWKSQALVEREILSLLDAEPGLIKNAQWRGSTLCFNYEGSPLKGCWSFKELLATSSERIDQNEAQILVEAKRDIERDLRGGSFVICDSLGQHGTARFPPASVIAIMNKTDLSEDERIEMLKNQVFGNYGIAMDVVANYSEDEWAHAR